MEIIDGEEDLEMGVGIAAVHADRQGARRHLSRALGHPAEQGSVEGMSGVEIRDTEFDVGRIGCHAMHLVRVLYGYLGNLPVRNLHQPGHARWALPSTQPGPSASTRARQPRPASRAVSSGGSR